MATDDIKGMAQGGTTPTAISDSSARDAKALADAIRMVNDQYRATASATEQWGRLSRDAAREHESLIAILKDETTAMANWGKQLFSLRRQVDNIHGSISGYVNSLRSATTISEVYATKLDYMRKGQEAFTRTLVANTNDLNRAQSQSQQYVNAIQDAYADAALVARTYNIDTKEVTRATDELNKRFATQIAVSGDMSGSLKGMQREAVMLGRYLGVDMTTVMDAWQARMQQTNLTMEDARKEFIAVSFQTDKYSRDLEGLGKEFLKTANVGRHEFIQMVMDVGKELRTGTFDAGAYSNALRGLLVQGKKSLLSANEQRVQAEALQRMMGSMFKFGEEGSIFGTRVAQKLIANWEDLSNIQNEGLRKRLEIVREQFKNSKEIDQVRAVMDVLRGSAAGNAEALRQLNASAGNSLTRQIVSKFTDGNILIANTISQGIKNDSLAQDFDKKAVKEQQEGQEDQTKVWEKSLEDLVKATHTPKDLEYKAIKVTEDIKRTLEYYVKMFPVWLAAAQLGGAVVGKLFGGLGGQAGTSILGRLVGGLGARLGGGGAMAGLMGNAVPGATAAAAPAGAGVLGTLFGPAAAAGTGALVAGVGTAAVAGVMAGRWLDKNLGPEIYKLTSEEFKRIEGKDQTLSGMLATKMLQWDKQMPYAKEIVRVRAGEYEKRKKLVDALDAEIAQMESNRDELTKADKQRLDAIKRERDAINKTIEHRQKLEKTETERVKVEQVMDLRNTLTKRVRMLASDEGLRTRDPKELIQRLLFEKMGKGTTLRETDLATRTLPQELINIIATLPKEMQAKFGDPAKLAQASVEAVLRHRAETETDWTKKQAQRATMEQLVAHGKEWKMGYSAFHTNLTPEEKEAFAAQQQAQEIILKVTGGGSEGPNLPLVPNAKGEIKIPQMTTINVENLTDMTKKSEAKRS